MKKVEISGAIGKGTYAVFPPDSIDVWSSDDVQSDFDALIDLSDEEWLETKNVFLGDWVVDCVEFDGLRPTILVIGTPSHKMARALFLAVLHQEEKVAVLMRPANYTEVQTALFSGLDAGDETACDLALIKRKDSLAERVFLSPYRIDTFDSLDGLALGFPRQLRNAA